MCRRARDNVSFHWVALKEIAVTPPETPATHAGTQRGLLPGTSTPAPGGGRMGAGEIEQDPA